MKEFRNFFFSKCDDGEKCSVNHRLLYMNTGIALTNNSATLFIKYFQFQLGLGSTPKTITYLSSSRLGISTTLERQCCWYYLTKITILLDSYVIFFSLDMLKLIFI